MGRGGGDTLVLATDVLKSPAQESESLFQQRLGNRSGTPRKETPPMNCQIKILPLGIRGSGTSDGDLQNT